MPNSRCVLPDICELAEDNVVSSATKNHEEGHTNTQYKQSKKCLRETKSDGCIQVKRTPGKDSWKSDNALKQKRNKKIKRRNTCPSFSLDTGNNNKTNDNSLKDYSGSKSSRSYQSSDDNSSVLSETTVNSDDSGSQYFVKSVEINNNDPRMLQLTAENLEKIQQQTRRPSLLTVRRPSYNSSARRLSVSSACSNVSRESNGDTSDRRSRRHSRGLDGSRRGSNVSSLGWNKFKAKIRKSSQDSTIQEEDEAVIVIILYILWPYSHSLFIFYFF